MCKLLNLFSKGGKPLGHIKLNESLSEHSILVAGSDRIYIGVQYTESGFFKVARKATNLLTFVPKEGNEYEVQILAKKDHVEIPVFIKGKSNIYFEAIHPEYGIGVWSKYCK